jgi:2-(1,2-epoxy-1,2-dihydrophenyl)acetyl-CoA isomerase
MGEERIDTGTDLLLASKADGVGILTINHPSRRNALAGPMFGAFRALLQRFAADQDVGCILLTGAGEAFCAGGDMTEFRQAGDGRRRTFQERYDELLPHTQTSQLLHEHPKVSVAAIPGPAVGAGLGLALACDLRIAADSARLVTGWSRLGLSGDYGTTWFLTRLLGPSRALELLMRSEPVDAGMAGQLGLVNRVVPAGDLLAEAMAWARVIASGPTLAWRYMKRNIRVAMRHDLAGALPIETENLVHCTFTAQHREALLALREGRPPSFRSAGS